MGELNGLQIISDYYYSIPFIIFVKLSEDKNNEYNFTPTLLIF